MNTLGATLAPIFGIMIVDYYKIRNEELNVDDLYNMEGGDYHYGNGWNDKALIAFAVASVLSVATVWVLALGFWSGTGRSEEEAQHRQSRIEGRRADAPFLHIQLKRP